LSKVEGVAGLVAGLALFPAVFPVLPVAGLTAPVAGWLPLEGVVPTSFHPLFSRDCQPLSVFWYTLPSLSVYTLLSILAGAWLPVPVAGLVAGLAAGVFAGLVEGEVAGLVAGLVLGLTPDLLLSYILLFLPLFALA
jgi:hypothetical protein